MLFLSRKSLVVTAVAVVCALSLVSCKGFFVDPTLSSIEVKPASPQVAVGTTAPLQAIGHYSDNIDRDITSKVTWATVPSSSTFFTINKAGVVTGVAVTPANSTDGVTATLGTTASPTKVVTVTASALTQITIDGNASPSIATTGGTAQYTATGHYADGSTQSLTATVAWDTSDHTVATIATAPAANPGQATLLKAGNITITASQGSVPASLAVSVSN
jgi:hypothetical protein